MSRSARLKPCGARFSSFFSQLPRPASAQLVAPLTTSDGRIACTQGQTGIGRASAWEAVADTQALGGWALAETAGDATDLRFPLCVSTQTVARDVDATLRFQIVSGTHAQVAGLLLRAQSANDYYVARASATDGTVRFYRMAGGRRAELAAKKVPVTSGEQHALRVIAKRERFEVFFDGTSLFSVIGRQPDAARSGRRLEPGRQHHPLPVAAGREPALRLPP